MRVLPLPRRLPPPPGYLGVKVYTGYVGPVFKDRSKHRFTVLLYEADPDTEAVVLFGEPGTGHEETAAALIAEGKITKPVVAFGAGESMERLPRGLSLGHSGAMLSRGLGSPSRKKALLREAGVYVAEHFGEIAPLVAEALEERGWRPA